MRAQRGLEFLPQSRVERTVLTVVHVIPLAEEIRAAAQLVLRTQAKRDIIRVVGIGGEFKLLPRIGIDTDAGCPCDDACTRAERSAACSDLRIELVL